MAEGPSKGEDVTDKSGNVEENETHESGQAFEKPIFTKLTSKTPKRSRRGGIFGSPAETMRKEKSTQSTDSSTPVTTQEPKKRKKRKKKRKSKKGKKKKSAAMQFLRDKAISDTEKDDDNDDKSEDEKSDEEMKNGINHNTVPIRRRFYHPYLGIPGERFLRQELEDPVTLVEEEFLSEKVLRLRTSRRQLAMDLLYNKSIMRGKDFKLLQQQMAAKEVFDRDTIYTPERVKELEDIVQSDTGTRRRSPGGSAISHGSTVTLAENPAFPVENLLHATPLTPKYDAVRFAVPMDIRLIQNMTPDDYLRRFCIPRSYFRRISHRVFDKHAINKQDLPTVLLREALTDFFGRPLLDETYETIVELCTIHESQEATTAIDNKFFIGCAGLVMRTFCRIEDPLMKSEIDPGKKDNVERMDFDLLRLNFKLLEIRPDTKKLLQFIETT